MHIRQLACFLWLLVLVATSALLAGLGRGDDVSEVFESLFGNEYRNVRATRSRVDDVALADRLVEAARQSQEQPALVELLCEKAYALAKRDPNGYETAIEAMELLAAMDSKFTAPSMQRVLEVLQLQLTRNDPEQQAALALRASDTAEGIAAIHLREGDLTEAIKYYQRAYSVARKYELPSAESRRAEVRRLQSLRTLYHKRDELERRIQADPSDSETGQLLAHLYFVELADPAMAHKHVTHVADQQLWRAIVLANRSDEQLAPTESLELAQLHVDLWKGTRSKHISLLIRAEHYYELYLSREPAETLERTAAKLALSEVRRHTKTAEATFFGVGATGTRFAYIVDTSGSMGQGRKLPVAMRELSKSIAGLPDHTDFYIVLFSSGPSIPPMQRGWTRAAPATTTHFIRWLANVDPGGGTQPKSSFAKVFKLAPPPDVIYFMTDGEISGFTADEVVGMNRGKNAVIHTFAFGDPASQDLLRAIARQSGGTYRFVPVD